MTNNTIPIAVIGGSGLYQMAGLSDVQERRISTPFGEPSDALIIGTLSGAREAEMCYAVMAHVTDYDVWREEEEPVSVDAMIATLNQNTALAQRVVGDVISALADAEPACECQDALGAAIITQRDLIPAKEIERLGPLVSRYLK